MVALEHGTGTIPVEQLVRAHLASAIEDRLTGEISERGSITSCDRYTGLHTSTLEEPRNSYLIGRFREKLQP